ncbi:hypothetical protein ACFQE8_10230 [Salinirubellus sp. GCM10025818]|uniref:hypothetical protein n=1 Tax=Salinirubellus TaxID=2162630 RepID=UPI0030D3F5DF
MDITLFEINLDGAQFGPATIGEPVRGKRAKGERMTEGTTVVTGAGDSGANGNGTSGGGRAGRFARFTPVLVVAGVAVGYAAFRRFRDRSPRLGVDAEPVEIET